MFKPFYILLMDDTHTTDRQASTGYTKKRTAALGSLVFILSTFTSKAAVLTVVDFEMVPYPKVFQSQVTVMFLEE